MQSWEGSGWLSAHGDAGQRKGWQHGHCLCLLPNADALILIGFFYPPPSPLVTVWEPKSLPFCNPPAPGLNREVAPGMVREDPGQRGLLLHPTSKPWLCCTLQPQIHMPRSQTGPCWGWVLPGLGACPLCWQGGWGCFSRLWMWQSIVSIIL